MLRKIFLGTILALAIVLQTSASDAGLLVTYGSGNPYLYDGGGGLQFNVRGDLSGMTVDVDCRLFLADLNRRGVVVINGHNGGSLEDMGWQVKMLRLNGLTTKHFVTCSLSHGIDRSNQQPWGPAGASKENAVRSIVGLMGLGEVGLADVMDIQAFGFSYGGSTTSKMAAMAGVPGFEYFRVFRRVVSAGAGMWEGNPTQVNRADVNAISAASVILLYGRDDYGTPPSVIAEIKNIVRSRSLYSESYDFPGNHSFTVDPGFWPRAAAELAKP